MAILIRIVGGTWELCNSVEGSCIPGDRGACGAASVQTLTLHFYSQPPVGVCVKDPRVTQQARAGIATMQQQAAATHRLQGVGTACRWATDAITKGPLARLTDGQQQPARGCPGAALNQRVCHGASSSPPLSPGPAAPRRVAACCHLCCTAAGWLECCYQVHAANSATPEQHPPYVSPLTIGPTCVHCHVSRSRHHRSARWAPMPGSCGTPCSLPRPPWMNSW